MSEPGIVDRLRMLFHGLPPGGAVTLTLSRADLEKLLSPQGTPRSRLDDMTVGELADQMDRAPSTVRAWAPDIPGAYRLGREWRFPRAAVRAWLDEGAPRGEPKASAEKDVDLGAWRQELAS